MSATDRPLGLVVMAYGTPRTPGEIEPYYTHIRRGRPPTPEQLADLAARYDAIGGISPLAERTEAQRAALERALDERMPGRWMVVLGQKHAAPFIEDAVAELAARRRRRGRRTRPGTSLLGLQRRRVPASGRRGRGAPGPARARRIDALAPRARLPRLPRRRGRARPVSDLPGGPQGAVHRPLAARAGAGRRPLPRRAARERGRGRRAGRSGALARLGPVLAERRPHARAVAGPRRPRGAPRPRRHRPQRGRAGLRRRASPPTTSRCSTTSTSRPDGWPQEVGLAFARTRSLNDDPAVMGALADRVVARRRPRPECAEMRRRPARPACRRGRGRDHRASPPPSPWRPDTPRRVVTVLEASDRVGGKILTTPFAGRPSTAAPTPSWPGCPRPIELCDELGLSGRAHLAGRAFGAGLDPRARCTAFRRASCSACPPTWTRLPRSGIVSPDGVARAAEDLARTECLGRRARFDDPEGEGDVSVGALVRARLGDEVFERLVAPLLSGVNAGDADQLSLAAGAAQLATAARRRPSLVAALRAPAPGRRSTPAPTRRAPVFYGIPVGTQTLTDLLLARLTSAGVPVHLAVPGRPRSNARRRAGRCTPRPAVDPRRPGGARHAGADHRPSPRADLVPDVGRGAR